MVGTFKIGEKVVYPAHGVGVIEGVQTKVISGSERKFYMLRILDSDMTIMIPTENVQSVGLRRIIGKDMVAKVYKILRDKKVEIAKVLRDLFVLKGDKELSFGERKMLDTARNLLVKELAIAKSFSEEKIMEELRHIFTHLSSWSLDLSKEPRIPSRLFYFEALCASVPLFWLREKDAVLAAASQKPSRRSPVVRWCFEPSSGFSQCR